MYTYKVFFNAAVQRYSGDRNRTARMGCERAFSALSDRDFAADYAANQGGDIGAARVRFRARIVWRAAFSLLRRAGERRLLLNLWGIAGAPSPPLKN
jgi:hypothetical protein